MIGMLPLRRFARLENGGTPTADETNWGGDVQWATPIDLARVDGGFIARTDRTLTPAGLRRGSATVPAGSILISSRAPIGYAAVTRATMAFNQGCKGLVPQAGVDARYLRYWLSAQREVLHAAGSGSTFMELNADALMRFDVPNMPNGEQRRIADFLDDQVARINRATTARRMQADMLTDERRSGVHSLVTGGLVATRQRSKLAWAETIPGHWRSVRVCQVAQIGTGHTPSRSKAEYWIDPGIPWLTTTDVYRFRFDQIDSIDDTEVHISQLGLENSAAVIHPAGTVGLSRTSASAGFAIHMAVPMATSQDFATWTPGPLLNDMYLLWCLRSMHQDLMGRLAMGSTHKTIYFPELMSVRIPLPPRSEQEAIVSSVKHFVDGARRHRAALVQSIGLLNELKRSLITAAVTGEFDVSSANGSRVPV